MNTEVVFDCEGDLPALPAYRVVDSEVDFLHYALEDAPLLIRGERLCAWAEAFYTLHGRPHSHQDSCSAALRRVFPALTREQARRLARKMGIDTVSRERISSRFVLSHCYPADYAIWQDAPSALHAARWLLWLYERQLDDAEAIVSRGFASVLERQAGDRPESRVYQASDSKQARALLEFWLGLREPGMAELGEFPLELPAALLGETKSAWMRRLIASDGAYFEQMLGFPLLVSLRQELADLAAQFYEQNPEFLTFEVIRRLQPYLSTQRLTTLEEHLPPPEPGALPVKEQAVLDWFQTEYLPYRRWQARHGGQHDREKVLYHAKSFASWYLAHYPDWLLESNWLSFQHTARLRGASGAVTFCIILDGLPAWDAEDFVRSASARVERLQLQQRSYCFAPVPTVTEFAKDALLKGVPPHLAPDYIPLGEVLPDNASPVRKLQDAQPGDLIFWRVAQPDSAYHFEAESKRERQVRAELDVILQEVRALVEHTPPAVSLKVIITTDHGRLLNPKTPRRVPVPDGMKAHGRAAWGTLGQQFDESGFSIDENNDLAAIDGPRFGMQHDMLIVLGEHAFENTRSGSESYPHGGLFPEEAIVPWFVFDRDAQRPDISATVSGKGEAQNSGILVVQITNSTVIELDCLGVMLSHGAQVSGEWSIAALKPTQFSMTLTPWPAKSEIATLSATLLFRQPSGRTFTIEVTPSLEAQSLYERDDSIFKDLGL